MSKKPSNGQFAMRSIALLKSPVMQVLSLTGWRILNRIEIELASHGGKDNGTLPVTHADFQQCGVHHHAVGPGLREVEALGLIEITVHGTAGNAGHRRPNLFRLTYRPTGTTTATDDWRNIDTVQEAETIARKARDSRPGKHWKQRASKKIPTAGKRGFPVPETGSGEPPFSVPETGTGCTKSPVPETGSTI